MPAVAWIEHKNVTPFHFFCWLFTGWTKDNLLGDRCSHITFRYEKTRTMAGLCNSGNISKLADIVAYFVAFCKQNDVNPQRSSLGFLLFLSQLQSARWFYPLLCSLWLAPLVLLRNASRSPILSCLLQHTFVYIHATYFL